MAAARDDVVHYIYISHIYVVLSPKTGQKHQKQARKNNVTVGWAINSPGIKWKEVYTALWQI